MFICFVESLKIFCFDTFFVRLLLNPSRLFVHEGCLVENMLFGFCWNSPMKQITLELTSNSIYIRVEKKTKTSSYPERVVYYTMLTVKIFFYDPFFTVAFQVDIQAKRGHFFFHLLFGHVKWSSIFCRKWKYFCCFVIIKPHSQVSVDPSWYVLGWKFSFVVECIDAFNIWWKSVCFL